MIINKIGKVVKKFVDIIILIFLLWLSAVSLTGMLLNPERTYTQNFLYLPKYFILDFEGEYE